MSIMFIDPTITHLVHRARVIVVHLVDVENGGNNLSARQIGALQIEYDNIASAMKTIRHPSLKPAPADYREHDGTLWAWWCAETRLHGSHNALTLLGGGVPR